MAELNEKQLETVSGGAPHKEKQVQVKVNITGHYYTDITIKVYVDGVLDRSKLKSVDPSITSVTYYFSGRGIQSIKIKINNDEVKTFSIHFDTDTYIEV